jgi:hypothetical protein
MAIIRETYVRKLGVALCAPAAAALGSLVPLSVPRGLVSQMRREGLSGEKASVQSMSWENLFQPLNPYHSGNI